jgi:arylsulfatase A-like enzyme
MDRSIGTLRQGLRESGIADDTLIWFNSDNGGLPKIEPGTVGALRGFKGSLYEGGLRVPSIVEWPAQIEPRVTGFPACTMDIFPTIAEIVGLPEAVALPAQDGISLRNLFGGEIGERPRPIPFRHSGRSALIDNDYKFVRMKPDSQGGELYNLVTDPAESEDLSEAQPQLAAALRAKLDAWSESVDASVAGEDYAGGVVEPGHPAPRFWTEIDAYRPYFTEWIQRPEYRGRLQK